MTSRNGADVTQSSAYLAYLPAVYQEDAFIGRFLRIFEDVLAPIQGTVNTLAERFDPGLAPQPMLDVISSWVGFVPSPRLPERAWRRLLQNSVELHRWRGTKRGLRTALELATGERVLIRDYGPGLAVGRDASLGVNMTLEEGPQSHVDITFLCEPDRVDRTLAADIIQGYKPGHITFSLSFSPVAVRRVAVDRD
jgi:phage tail-like protein